MTTTCATVACYGKTFPGHPLRCPSCGGTLLFYKRPAPVAALRAAA